MFDNAHITAITGFGQVVVPNPSRDGSGTIVDLITALRNGCLVQSVTVKAQETTTNGLVRLFLHNGTNSYLLEEFFVNTAEPSDKFETTSSTLIFPNSGLFLQSGYKLQASTVHEEVFNVFASAFTWDY